MDAETFRRLGHRLVDEVAALMASIAGRPVTTAPAAAAVRDALGLDRPLPDDGADPERLLAGLPERLAEHSLFNAHPRFFGYITAPPAPIGVLADFMAAALNPNVGAWVLSPAATAIEVQTVRWIAELIGFPATAGGLLVSGGNMANLVCFLAARAARAPWDVRTRGVAGGDGRLLVAYASDQTHTWLQKAADVSGLGTAAVRWIPSDADERMDVEALDRAIAADRAEGRCPFLVIGTAGTVATGAVDPLREIAGVCRRNHLWFHVDGAYGGMAAALREASEGVGGLEEADSVAVDPHKWLYAPLEAGCVLVRDRDALPAAFAYRPPYYHFDPDETNYVDYGLQNSRGFRALKVWLALQHAGASGYRSMMASDIARAQRLARAVEQHPALELHARRLSIATFRYVPPDLAARAGEPAVARYLNALNEAVLDAIQRGGRAFVSNAVVRQTYLLRACIVNFHTTDADVVALAGIAASEGARLDAERRAAFLP